MKLGIIISTNDPETVWNALKFAVVSLKADHEVKVFLMGKGAEIENIEHDIFNVKEQMDLFLKNEGKLLACEACLLSRNDDCINVCPLYSMLDLLNMVEESDRILTFG